MVEAMGILFLSDTHWFKFIADLGMSTNNRVELLALKLTMLSTSSYEVQSLQVFGDSKSVIDWMRLKSPLKNIPLRP